MKKKTKKVSIKSPKIIFISCRGNTCRSPITKYLLESKYQNNKKIKFDSCGTKIRVKDAPISPQIVSSLQKMKMNDVAKKTKKHKSKSCNCKHLELVGKSDGIFYYVEKKIRGDLKKLFDECKLKNPNLKKPTFKLLDKINIIDPYDFSCSEIERKTKHKCSSKQKRKSNKIYQQSINQIKKAINNLEII